MKQQPKEVDEYAETEVLDRSALDAIDFSGDVEPAVAYEEYSRLLASEAAARETPAARPAKKNRR
jgi:hypothetical protein